MRIKLYGKPLSKILRQSITVVILILSVFLTKTAKAETTWKTTGLMKPNITSLKVTPMGLFAGEFNTKYWELPFNGIYFSPINSNGSTWEKSGLAGLGVTDIEYLNNKIYTTTFYSTDQKQAGLYYSEDWGNNWEHIGPNLPAKSIGVTEGKIFLGTFDQGLWISKDQGSTWKKINLSLEAESTTVNINRVEKIFIMDGLIIVEGYGGIIHFFSSRDEGETWEREEWLEVLRAHDFLMYSNLLYVATDYLGIQISKDYKNSFSTAGEFYNEPVLSLYKIGINLYATVLRKSDNKLEIYESSNQGITWYSTGISEIVETENINEIQGMFGNSSFIFANIPNKGIYRRDVIFTKEKEPFLGSLWQNQKPNDLLNRITSFFDHEYPFLGSSLFSEPKEFADSTVNFLGQEGEEPEIYYSSHNGYDFGLPYGTEILAPADGLVSGHYCIPCGNTLFIDHPNGYRTVYMHLQKDGLIAQSWEKNLPVNEGDVIGKVGMTGNTTGPHLHFQVYKPAYGAQLWEIMHPKNLLDPFGWKNDFKYDPWAFFKWQDPFGDHSGTASKDLWKEDITLNEIKKAFNGQPLLMDLRNINIQIPSTTYSTPLSFQLAYITPPSSQEKSLKYIDDTSLGITALKATGEKISQLSDFITIRIALTLENIQDVIWDTLAIYHWNDAEKIWEKLLSNFDSETLVLEAQTNRISQFAVFGEKTVIEYPHTSASLTGDQTDYWYTEYPLVTLESEQTSKILYSLYGEFWEEYTKPFYIEGNGIVRLRYRSIGNNGLVEPLQVLWVRIDRYNKPRKTLFIKGTQLTIL
jgi:murein DD-endopeptidase MepM/ murein hydrolase activator NlpD